MTFKYRPPARGANEPSYPHLSFENLPPKPGPNRVELAIATETRLARRHYFQPHQRIVPGCEECASAVLTATWGMSAAWFPVDVEGLFRR
jgi:hypothetical protein